MRLSGWAGLAALAATTALFCLSGKLIVAGFQKLPPDVPATYPALGARTPCARFPALSTLDPFVMMQTLFHTASKLA